MLKNNLQILFIILLTAVTISSEPFANQKVGKDYDIVEKNDVVISIDGLMIEKEWSDIKVIDDYSQSHPINMSESSFKTETRLFYTNEGIYIFSRMYDEEPNKIQERLSNRDDYEDGFLESADWIYFSFDSRHDHQTGYLFAVNCSGIQLDAAIYDDEGLDYEYNALWYSETNIDEFGWTVEMMIPFSALRFDSSINETWGFESKRYIFRLDEIDSWMVFPHEVSGVSSKYGHIHGFKDIQNFKKLQASPYISYNGTIEKESELELNADGGIISKDRFKKYDETYNKQDIGFDLKYNLNTRTTLDISYNPDFGQIEVDPADINISYYETYLSEKRPFFTENSMLFSLPIEMFYSRRIGEFKDLNNYDIEIPTTIDYAAKISGKEDNGFSFGFISALTSNEVNDTLNISPYIGNNKYNILKLKQDILSGNSFIGLMISNYSGLRGQYSKNLETNIYENDNSILDVSTYSIDCKHNLFDNRLQTDFQYSISSVNKEGHANYLNASYNINEYWTTFLNHEYINPSFDNNDIGYIKRNDINSRGIGFMYHNLDVSEDFIERSISVNYINQYNISNNLKLKEQISLSAKFDLINNNSIIFNVISSNSGYDDRLLFDLRDNLLIGKAMVVPNYNVVALSWDSDFREELSFSTYLSYKKNSINDYQYLFRYSQVYRPSYNLKMSFNYHYKYLQEKYHWLETITVDDVDSDYFGPHHIFSEINATLQKYVLRLDAFINKDFTLQSYTEFIQTDDNLSDWTELLDGDYPEYSDFINQTGGFGGYSIYADEGQNPQENQQANPNNDPFFYSKYNEVIFNLVFKWKFSQRSDFYAVYTRYWLVNGEKFASFFDFLEYSGNESWIEKSFDQGISLKYSYRFDI